MLRDESNYAENSSICHALVEHVRLGPRFVAEFAHKMREQITSGDITFRKAYLGAIVDRIEVNDRELRMPGRKDVLEQAAIASAASRAVVRTFVPKWLGD